jgi:hypothetical protein
MACAASSVILVISLNGIGIHPSLLETSTPALVWIIGQPWRRPKASRAPGRAGFTKTHVSTRSRPFCPSLPASGNDLSFLQCVISFLAARRPSGKPRATNTLQFSRDAATKFQSTTAFKRCSRHWGRNAGGGTDDDCAASFRGATLRAFLRGGGETGSDRGGDDLSCMMSCSTACNVTMFWDIWS